MKIYHSAINTSVGELSLFASNQGLHRISWGKHFAEELLMKWFPGDWEILWNDHNTILQRVQDQLQSYFIKKLLQFNLPLEPKGTPFQLSVWNQLQKIPYGYTWSYQQLATAIGKPNAIRAVGNANARNPIPIIIPCHRVIRKNGNLGGYGGGIVIKDRLLAHEGVIL